ncbi:MAG: hypothetical protein ACRDV0_03145 [Acidimicrobiales bacterium]
MAERSTSAYAVSARSVCGVVPSTVIESLDATSVGSGAVSRPATSAVIPTFPSSIEGGGSGTARKRLGAGATVPSEVHHSNTDNFTVPR